MGIFQTEERRASGLLIFHLIQGYLSTCDSTVSPREAQRVSQLEHAANIFFSRGGFFTAQDVIQVSPEIGDSLIEAIVEYAYAMDEDPDTSETTFFEYDIENPNRSFEVEIELLFGQPRKAWELVDPGFFSELVETASESFQEEEDLSYYRDQASHVDMVVQHLYTSPSRSEQAHLQALSKIHRRKS